MALALLLGAWAFAGLGAGSACLERAHDIPEGWQRLSEAPDAHQRLRMSFALRQPDTQTLYASLNGNTRLCVNQIRALRTPAKDDVDSVLRWLASSGVSDAQSEKDWIHVRTTVAEAEKLLNMKMHRYSFEGKPPILRTTEYFIPDTLSGTIRFAHPIANFMTPTHDVAASRELSADKSIQQRALPACEDIITPGCITKQYSLNYTAPKGKSPVRFAVAGFLDQFANYADTDDFLRRTNPELAYKGYNFSVELINGGQNPQDRARAGSEANLDIEYALAIGYPTEVTYYSTGGRGVKLNESGQAIPVEFSDNEPYLEMVEYMLDMPDDELPHVLTMSYADDELSVPRPYAERVCALFGMLAARGMSVIVASGDGGARGGRNASCRTNDGYNRETTVATFPGSCPWVTAVGATTNSDNPPKGAYFSTGGFSQWFKRESWQDEAVDGYIKALQGRLEGFYNPKMRAIPDISAVGTQFLTVVNGKDVILDGTSASAPVLAAMIALANDARLRQGKPSLGWLNKRLYSAEVRRVLYDTQGGVSKPCPFSGGKSAGWPAAKGWDAITGLGTPGKFDDFLRVLVEGY
ncbi:pro-kumamolisin, activation domain-containing protein [Hirsutella rhossiliensis]|uniref:tripeptidyl-peptidase II n=1 Tax=Hirsutella rhossiliensis TaxID=111463 RepID=A0A9P8SNB8_9HYPO|nr:pro-kumamolisin, activation domain-containing protein [Hirsutella rhossiliensis]KAH0967715.1 pro-kumamolisin, activation domain-containing protein [Hirsutella rhossiliensis]